MGPTDMYVPRNKMKQESSSSKLIHVLFCLLFYWFCLGGDWPRLFPSKRLNKIDTKGIGSYQGIGASAADIRMVEGVDRNPSPPASESQQEIPFIPRR